MLSIGGDRAVYNQDLAAGVVLRNGLRVATFTAFDTYDTAPNKRSAVHVLGTVAADDIAIRAADVTADLQGGNDRLHVDHPARLAGSGALDGGEGRDQLGLATQRDLRVDLKAGTLVFRSARSTGRFSTAGFEELAGYARHARIAGSDGRDIIAASACEADVRGRGGRDVLRLAVGFVPQCLGRLHGGRGPDVLRGGWGNDLLVGGPGRDTAFGSQGNDACVAEREASCER
jgi:Ca2+-binding RTX toxin-like protein